MGWGPDGRRAVSAQDALADTMAAFADAEAAETTTANPFPTGPERFENGQVLGRGGMGTVYVAEDKQFGRDVALKEMATQNASTEGIRRFLVESLVTGNLEHPGIPAVYERGVRDGRPFYAMRKVEGRTLAAAVAATSSFEERLTLLPRVVQVAHTLGFAHERGVVHRDVKPDNVVLGDHGETVLLDWGIARVRGSGVSETGPGGATDPGASATVAGAVMGTPAYMAPEQAAGRVEDIDERTDVFALGAMLYHVLGGLPPYAGPTSLAVLKKALEGERVPLRRLAPKARPELLEVVNTAMAKDPADRHPNAAAFADALQLCLTRSVAQRGSTLVNVLAAVAALVVLAVLMGTIVLIAGQVSSFAEQGFASWMYIGTSAIGLLMGVVEWRTRSAYRLGPLVLALAAVTLLIGFVGSASGFALIVRFVQDLPAEQQTQTLLEGLWEITGAIPLSGVLTALQLIVWAIGRRATLLDADQRA